MPTASGGHIDQYLTNYSRKLTNTRFVAEMCATVVPVGKDTDKVATYGNEHLRRVSSLRAPGSPPNDVDYTTSSIDYILNEHALRDLVTDEEVENADSPLTPREDAAANVQERVLIEREKEMADHLFSTAIWSQNTTLSGTSQWSDFANSDPFKDVRTGQNSVLKNSLRVPNTMVMGYEVLKSLIDHPDVLDRIKYTSAASVTPEILARLFDVERVLVGSAVENTAKEGATDSLAYIWGKDVWIGFVAPRPSLRVVTASTLVRGRSFPQVRRYRHPDDGARAEYVEYADKWDIIEVLDGGGYLIKSAVI